MADENQANVTYLNPPSLERSRGYARAQRSPAGRFAVLLCNDPVGGPAKSQEV